jgi:hypothetical protein
VSPAQSMAYLIEQFGGMVFHSGDSFSFGSSFGSTNICSIIFDFNNSAS